MASRLLILYGTQTGTAKDLSERIARDALRTDVKPFLHPMNYMSVGELSTWIAGSIVIFVVSTTGQGDTPKTMDVLWKALCKKSLSQELFKGMKFAVIALGDSSYPKFNFVGKRLFRRMMQLGGKPILNICLGDDQHDLGYEGVVDPWLEEFWHLCAPKGFEPESEYDWDCSFHLQSLPPTIDVDYLKIDGTGVKMTEVQLIENRRLSHVDHFQDLRLISIPACDALKYAPGIKK